MIYFVVNRFQVTKLKDLVHEVDETAYITNQRDGGQSIPANN